MGASAGHAKKGGDNEEQKFTNLEQVHPSCESLDLGSFKTERRATVNRWSEKEIIAEERRLNMGDQSPQQKNATSQGSRESAAAKDGMKSNSSSKLLRQATRSSLQGLERRTSLALVAMGYSSKNSDGTGKGKERLSLFGGSEFAPAGADQLSDEGFDGLWEENATGLEDRQLDEVRSATSLSSASWSDEDGQEDEEEGPPLVFISSRDVVLVHLIRSPLQVAVYPLWKDDNDSIIDSQRRSLSLEYTEASKTLQWNGKAYEHCNAGKEMTRNEIMFWSLLRSALSQPLNAFLELGSFQSQIDPKQTGPQLLELVRVGDPQVVIQLLKKGSMDCTYRGIGGSTCLHVACKRGVVEVLEPLLIQRADPDAQDRHGRTPIWYAAECGYAAVVEALMSNDANHLIVDTEKVSPLMAAVRRGKEETEKVLRKTMSHATVTDMHEAINLFDGPIFAPGPQGHVNRWDTWQLTHRLLDGYDAGSGSFKYKATRAVKVWQLIARPLLAMLTSGEPVPREELALAKYVLSDTGLINAVSQEAYTDGANADAELSAQRSAALMRDQGAVKHLGVGADTVEFRLHRALEWQGDTFHQVNGIGVERLDFIRHSSPTEMAKILWDWRVLSNLQDFIVLAHEHILEEKIVPSDDDSLSRIDFGKSTARFRSAALSLILISDARRVATELTLRLRTAFGSRVVLKHQADDFEMRRLATQKRNHLLATQNQFGQEYGQCEYLSAGGVCDIIQGKVVFSTGAELREAVEVIASWTLSKERMEVVHVLNGLHPTSAVQGGANMECGVVMKILLQVAGSERYHLADVQFLLQDFMHFKEYAELIHPILLKSAGEAGQEVKQLGAALHDQIPVKRKEAAEALGKLGARGGRYAAEVASLLKDRDLSVRCAAAEAIGLFGEAGSSHADEVALLLQDPLPEARLAAVAALGCLGDVNELHGAAGAAQAASIAACLQDSQATVRCAAARALGRMGNAVAPHVGALGSVLLAGCPDTEAAAVEALGQIGPAGVQHCAQMLKSPDPAVQCKAASALSQMGSAGTIHAGQLATIMKSSKSSTVRRASVEALGKMGDAGVQHVQEIAGLLGDKDVQASATKALLQLGPQGTTMAAALLKDSTQPAHVRSAAVATLGKMGDVAASHVEEVAALLVEPDIGVRTAACKALAELGDAGACHAADVAALLRKRYPEVRLAAARALELMGRRWREHVIAEILPLLHDEKIGIRCAVIEALGHMGDTGTSLVADVAMLLGHQDDSLRRAATKSLARMGDIGAREAAALLCDGSSGLRVQKAAAEVLAAMGDTGARHAAALLKLSEWGVQRSAAEALGDMGGDVNRKAVHAAALLKTSNPDVQCRAVLTLGSLGDAGARHSTAVALLLRDANISVRRAAAEVIGQFGERGASHAATLSLLLHDPDATVQCTAVESLGKLGSAGARHASRILRLLNGNTIDGTVRCAAIKALSSLVRFCGGAQSLERPESRLTERPESRLTDRPESRLSSRPESRAMDRPESSLSGAFPPSESVLGSVQGSDGKKPQHATEEEEMTPAIITAKIVELLKDPEPNVRASAADALGEMAADGVTKSPGDEEMQIQIEAQVEAIGALLTDSAPGVRRAAIEAVGIMATPGPWINDVQFLLQDAHPGVRRAAECVFKRLEADGVNFEEIAKDTGGGIHKEVLEEVDLEDEEDYDHEFEGSETEGQHEGSESGTEGESP
eukprot:gnl/MRDRNA2_/MRDRNA2_51604_c0_seq2.p1 gnl/MRDRNA2_/MRDRNA2_51604_c0~~gnl/MRDRNA2_/MRDRNA2_51604_c0_seq2.p1  ORF type:complete len:1710 (-),score=379.49 gnl/MRDRNA2_/MRDRNA2_51604_c0_seq2:14-5143(-)